MLVVTESFLPQVNGVTNSVCRVLEHLSADGHEAHVVAPSGPPSYAGAAVHRARSLSLPQYADFPIAMAGRPWLRRMLRRIRPDVVHLASPALMGLRAAEVAREMGIPVVAIYQTDLIGFAERYRVPGARHAMETLTRRIHQGVDRTLAPSTASVAQLAHLGCDGLWLWPRGVDGTLFHPDKRSEERRRELLAGARILVGFVGRLAPEKELRLLRATCDLPGVQVVLVGGGPEESALRAALPRATFAGVLHGEELARTVASCDVVVHPGRHETFCQAVQEALASGVPVVAADAGGPRDLVDPGRNGALFTPGDGEALAAHVDALAADAGERRRLGLAARASVDQRTWPCVNAQLVEHYRDVVTAAAPQRAIS